MENRFYSALKLSIGVIVFSSCSLIVSNKLEEKNKNSDSGLANRDATGIRRDALPYRDANASDGLSSSDGIFAKSDNILAKTDGPAPTLNVTGEQGNQGPFTIGEQIHIKLTGSAPTEAKSALIGSSGFFTPCPGEVIGDEYVCVIPPLTLDGNEIEYHIVNGETPAKEVQNGKMPVRRLILAGGKDLKRILLFDAHSLQKIGELPIPGTITEEKPLLSPSGRFLTFAFTDNNKLKLAIADLVIRRVQTLPLYFFPGKLAAAGFEPEYNILELDIESFNQFLGTLQGTEDWDSWEFLDFPIFRLEKFLWITDNNGVLYRIGMPTLPDTIENSPWPIEMIGMEGITQVEWIMDYRGNQFKWMAGLVQKGTEPLRPSIFAISPNDVKKTYFVTDTDQPKGTPIHLTSVQGEQTNIINKRSLHQKLAAAVLHVDFDSSLIDHYVTLYQLDTDAIILSLKKVSNDLNVKELQKRSPDNLTPLVAMPYTNLLNFKFMSSPINTFTFGHVLYKALAIQPFSITQKSTSHPVMQGMLTTGLPTNYNPINQRVLVTSGEAVSIFAPNEGTYLTPKSRSGLKQSIHHPRRERFYLLTNDFLTSFDYFRGNIEQQVNNTDLAELKGMLEGLMIQP